MLNCMGAKISGIASNLLTIEGVKELHGTEHTVLPDMIEVGSFIGMAAMPGGDVTIKNVSYENLGIIPDVFSRMGITIERKGDDIHIPSHESYEVGSFIDGSIMTFSDAPWPGLTPDLLSVLLVVATQAKGSVLIHQKMFESRSRMSSPDIRAGIAMLIAAMSAEGVSRISNIEQIDRGYEDIEGRLNALGANIRRED